MHRQKDQLAACCIKFTTLPITTSAGGLTLWLRAVWVRVASVQG